MSYCRLSLQHCRLECDLAGNVGIFRALPGVAVSVAVGGVTRAAINHRRRAIELLYIPRAMAKRRRVSGKLEDWAAHRCASCDAPGTIVCREGGWRNYLVCSAECGEPQWSACTVCAGAGRGPGGCHKTWQQHSNRSFHRSNLGRRGGGGEECAPCGDGDDGGIT